MSLKEKIMPLQKLNNFLNKESIKYKKNHLLKYESYFKTGGVVKFFILPHSIEEMKNLLFYLNKENIAYKVLGFTSNVYLLDELEYTVIISTKNLNEVHIKDKEMHLSSGYSLEAFSRLMLLEQSAGYEGLEGIPASIGGAIFMNASAYGCAISDYLLTVSYLNKNNEIKTITKTSCLFGHRTSFFKENPSNIILSASFQINKGKAEEIATKMTKYHSARHSYQEFAYPNLGTMFAVQGDFYREFVKKSPFYYWSCYMLKIIYKNPLSKFLLRKNPHNHIFNKLIKNYVSPIKITQPYSKKSMNILINNGSSSLEERLAYIKLIKSNLHEDTELENEIVLSPIVENETNAKIIKKINLL